ncbi:MAG: ATP synthase F0F1 subunit A [Betaproteobacteria bacterium SG8_41]|jgi:F-type H+-transporting ATPase subunit a|nr:MAG: ATP synthase F0F1 subunit A [Betaproteobacteria bacterium SG8_41]
MAAGSALTPSNYIEHHLTFLSKPVGEGQFWVLHVDSLVTSIALGCIGLGLIWWVIKGATAGVPNRRQAFVELLIHFVDNQAKEIFLHGDRHRFIAPAALTVFVWVLLMNAMDWLPVDLFMVLMGVIGVHEWRPVPTADVNTTFALSITVLLLSLYFGIAVKGLGGWIHEMFCAPFGSNPLLWPFNFLFNLVEYFSKTLSHSLRLFGNIYAGEIIFFLLWVWAATGVVGTFFGFFFGLGWMIFHILIIVLQAYIFMMLTIVYISMAHEHH